MEKLLVYILVAMVILFGLAVGALLIVSENIDYPTDLTDSVKPEDEDKEGENKER